MSSPDLFVDLGNLYMVPVVRQRLAFAELVRQVFFALSRNADWDGEQDLICVTLPRSIRDRVYECLTLLPKVTQIWAWDSSQTAREVVAVTPCDAFVEAIRIGTERSISVEFVDAEILPGNLLNSPCTRQPDWPDDSLVGVVGIRAYMKAVGMVVARHPFRTLPTDEWREDVIVQRLRQLMPLWRRILLICDISLAEGVKKAVSCPSAPYGVFEHEQTPGRLTVQRTLNLTAILNQLDDFPKLVEVYENERTDTKKAFDKRQKLLEEVSEFITQAGDIRKSTRQFEKFSIYLNNLLNVERRICPEPGSLYSAIAGCFGRALAERVHCHLTGYFGQVAVERLRPRSFGDRGAFRYSLDISSTKGGFGARECQPVPPQYTVSRPIRPTVDRRDGKNSEYSWPAEREAIREANRKLQGLMLARTPVRKSRKFEGAVERGVDVRRTLRSVLSDAPCLYVRQNAPEPEHIDFQREPVLWVFRDEADRSSFVVSSHGFEDKDRDQPVGGRNPGGEYFISSQDFVYLPEDYKYFKCILKRDKEGNVELMAVPRLGRLTFGIQFTNEKEARTAYGDDFVGRVPNHRDFEHPNRLGCVHRNLVHLFEREVSWLEIAFRTALEYANVAVLVVLPTGMVLPGELGVAAARAGKKVLYVSLDKFSRTEQDRLRTHYRLVQTRDQYSYQYFQRIMAQFWT